ncbi:MAG: bis-aminopropyl spermidine synthase family protein [Candidatus Odinarchaeota archaeon]
MSTASKIGFIITITVIFSFSLLPFVMAVNGQVYLYGENDKFTLSIKTELSGISGDYSGYTESEHDIRTYEILSVSDTSIQWKMVSDFKLTSNEGDYMTSHETYYFETDPRNGAYLNNTIDGPESNRDYYTFDYIWFKIDPTLPVSSQVRILGNDFTVRGSMAISLELFTSVDVIKVDLLAPVTRTVNNYDYDPDGQLEVTTKSESYYFDPETGYLVKSTWSADGITSVGKFHWNEKITVTESSFPLQRNVFASLMPVLIIIIIIVGLIASVFLFFRIQKNLWKKQVERAMSIITGALPPPRPRTDLSAAPTIWDPLTVDYKVLLDGLGGDEKIILNQGIYIITDTNNRLAIADIHTDQHLPNQVLPLREDNIKFFYRLALGMVDIPSGEANLINQYENTLDRYACPSEGFALVDKYALDVFASSPVMREDPDYEQVAYLLSRRRVLDYSHGQAPLSPSSHLRKMREVLKHAPKEVLMIGDDDLVSISLAKYGIKVNVVEIDPYTCALIEGIASIEQLPVKILQHDLRLPFPPEYSREYDLFVADPDFTIEAFALFLTRGLSLLRTGGTGLINFENRRGQLFKAKYLLEALKVEMVREHKEQWRYVIIKNEKVPIGSHYSGKYVHVDYADDLVLAEAAYSSIMFTIRRTSDTVILLQDKERFLGSPNSIYDF